MSKKITLNIDQDLYQQLENRFKGDEQELKQFIINSIKTNLNTTQSSSESNEKDDLEGYLQNGATGSRTYGVKGQGW